MRRTPASIEFTLPAIGEVRLRAASPFFLLGPYWECIFSDRHLIDEAADGLMTWEEVRLCLPECAGPGRFCCTMTLDRYTCFHYHRRVGRYRNGVWQEAESVLYRSGEADLIVMVEGWEGQGGWAAGSFGGFVMAGRNATVDIAKGRFRARIARDDKYV